MRHDPRAFLWDAHASAETIARFVSGRSLDAYRADEMLRAAVERHLGVIGEALKRLEREDPTLAARIPELRLAVALRNRLIHGYATLDDAVIWRTATTDVPALAAVIAGLLEELGG